MKKSFYEKKGISLISIIIIAVLAVILIYVLLGLLKDGILVLSKAQTAGKETMGNQTSEGINLVLTSYNMQKTTDLQLTFEAFLNKDRRLGNIDDYWYSDRLVVIKYKSDYGILLPDARGESFELKGQVKFENDEMAKKSVENYIKSIDLTSKENIPIEDKNVYIISKEVRSDCYDYVVGDYQSVGFVFLDDIEVNNKNKNQPAIEVGNNSSLDIYAYKTLTISSLYNGNEEIEYNKITAEGGYAGIKLPSTSNLKFRGNGVVNVYGGPAGKGGTYDENDLKLGCGGGGAGAGIGGNGGKGGMAKEIKSDNGGDGEDCGTVIVADKIHLNAYGGAGAEGGNSTLEGAGAGGGYPGAGIGGGGAGGGGATKLLGAGGFSGGASISVEGEDLFVGGKDGFAGGHLNDKNRYEYYYSGGGYFSGPDGIDSKKKDRSSLCLGGFLGCGSDINSYSSTGGKGGNGGILEKTDYSNINAYNGNKITDNSSTEYTRIYNQDGKSTEKYSYKKVEGMTFVLNKVTGKKKVKVTKFGQGIGSGAGYTEGTNGIFRNKTAKD